MYPIYKIRNHCMEKYMTHLHYLWQNKFLRLLECRILSSHSHHENNQWKEMKGQWMCQTRYPEIWETRHQIDCCKQSSQNRVTKLCCQVCCTLMCSWKWGYCYLTTLRRCQAVWRWMLGWSANYKSKITKNEAVAAQLAHCSIFDMVWAPDNHENMPELSVSRPCCK